MGNFILLLSADTLIIINIIFYTIYYFFLKLRKASLTNNYILFLGLILSSILILLISIFYIPSINIIQTFIKNLILIIILLAVFLNSIQLKEKNFFIEAPLPILFLVLGCFFLISSTNFFNAYLSIELQSFALLILISGGASNHSISAKEATLKFFIFSCTSSLLFLMGLSLLYIWAGSLEFNNFNLLLIESLSNSIYIYFFLILISFGILFKLCIFPFHFWVADIYDGATPSSLLLLATIPKITLIYFLILFLEGPIGGPHFYEQNLVLISYFSILGGFSVLYGTIMALFQIKINRLLAYSTIANMGVTLIALCIPTGFYLKFIYIFTFLVAYPLNLLVFISMCTIFKTLNKKHAIQFIPEFKEALNNNIWLVFSFTMILLSLAGLPPFAIFFGKFYLYLSLINAESYFLFFCLSFHSIISSLYYLRLILNFWSKDLNSDFPKDFIAKIPYPIILIFTLILLFNLCLPFILDLFLILFI